VIAIALVVMVMYLFLQSWRATLVPGIAVPVVLLGTFGILALFGYSINIRCSAWCWPSACWWMTPSWWSRTSNV
jgi:multidrug efflux pump